VRSKVVVLASISALVLTAVLGGEALAATSGRVYKTTVDGAKYCLESQITPTAVGIITAHSSSTCSNATAVGLPAGYLGVAIHEYYDPERDGSYLFCGDSGLYHNPANNTWLFSVSAQYCPTPAGLQNYKNTTRGTVLATAGWWVNLSDTPSPSISA
jgi:hypothetical protein